MKKIVIALLLIVIPLNIYAIELPKLYSDKVLLYDIKGDEILYEKGMNIESSIASLTKIMTTIVAIESIKDLDEVVTIGAGVLNEIPWDASVAGLKLGDRVTYKDLLIASILPSGADATTALAHNIAGSTENFVELMNKKAQELGLEHTHFSNVTGYESANHYSTPRELLTILKYSLSNPIFEEIYKMKQYKLSNGLVVYSTLNTYNRFLKADLSSILGSKTGYTTDAGMCMSALFKTKDREMLLITLGAPYNYVTPFNLKDTISIIEHLDTNYDEVVLFQKGSELETIEVEDSKEEEYIIRVDADVSKYVDVHYKGEDLTHVYEGLKTLSYKNSYGEKIGEVKYYYKDELIKTEPVFLYAELNFSIKKFIAKNPLIVVLTLTFIVVCVVFLLVRKRKKNRRVR